VRRRLGARTRIVLLAAAVLVAAGVVGTLLVRQAGPRASPKTAGVRYSTSFTAGPPAATPSGQTGQGRPTPRPPLAAGKVPAPTQAGVVEEVTEGTLQPLPLGSTHLVLNVANLPLPATSLAVYRFAPASGPADGSILELNGLPRGLASTGYPSQAPADAFTAAATREGAGISPNLQRTLPVTQARLVYVSVVTGGQGYLEPAYLFSGSMRFHAVVQAQVLVSALAPSILQ
jgi:hypothetical protein